MLLTVNQASTCTAMTSSLNPAAAGQAITFTAVVGGQWSMVSGQWPSGVLTFQDGGTPLGTGAVNGSGAATFSTTTLNAGRHTISAVYGGDSWFVGSTSAALTQTVLPVATMSIPTTFSGGIGSSIAVPVNLDRSDSLDVVDLAISYDTSRLEILSAGDIQPGTLTSEPGNDANGHPWAFDGFVANYDNTAGTVRLSTYRSSGAIFGFGSGSLATIHFHIKAAALPGAAIINLQPHVQTTTTVLHGRDATGNDLGKFTLQPAPSDAAGDALDGLITVLPSTLTTVVSSLNPATVGQTVGFTATVSGQWSVVSGQWPSGTVTFADGSTSLGTGLLDSSGNATWTTSGLTVGGHSITAVYGGDTGFPGSTSAAVIQSIHAATVRVTALTPTATGFQAVFDRLLDTSLLNLYDDSTGTLGPEDVTLIGAGAGQIRGSLVVDTVMGQQRITFIQTGQAGVLGSAAAGTLFGVLPNDTYTVTLRSAANGFQDTSGNLLDGNANGTPGDNFGTTFVVNNASNSVTVTLPDFARSAGQLVNVPNTAPANDTFTNSLPLRLCNGINFTGSTTNGSPTVQVLTTTGLQVGDTVTGPDIFGGSDTISAVGTGQITLSHNATATSASLANGGVVLNDSATTRTITSVALTLAYDPSLLILTGYSIAGLGDPGDSAVTTFDTSTAGLVNITFTTSTGIVLGPGGQKTFLSLRSNVPITAGYGAKEILDLQNIQINGGSITALDDAAIHVSGFLGDVTGDGIYTGLDAQRISRVAVGIDPGFRQWVLADPLIVGDVSGDNVLTGLDALQIARQAVGITQGNVPLLPAMTPTIAGPDPVLSISTDFAAEPQATVQVPVNLDHSAGLASVDLAIAYDTSRLDVSSAANVQRGSLTNSFDSFTVNVDQAAGLIRISGYRSAGPVAGSGSGSLAVINFQVRANAPAGPAIINLMQNIGTTWSLPGGTDTRGNDFLFDLEPRVSNAAGDPLDGVINVTRTGDGVPTTLSADDGRVTVPASLAADIFFSQYPATVQNDILGSEQGLLSSEGK